MSASVRFAAAGGAVFPVLLLAGLVMQAVAVGGADEESAQEVVARYSDGGNELWAEIGSLLVGLAIARALPWLAGLRAVLVSAEGARPVFATAANTGGALMATLLAVAAISNAAAFSSYDFYEAYETDASTVLLLQSVSFYALGFAVVGGGVLVGATSIVALRSALLPRWLAVAGLVLAAILVFGEWALFFAFPIPALLLWILVVSLVLLRRGRQEAVVAVETRRVATHNP